MNHKNNRTKDIKIKKLITIAMIVLSCTVLVLCISGCSVFDLIKETYFGEEESLELPQVEIDEGEINEIGKSDVDIRKSYDIESEISLIDESIRDPFKPFYIQEEEEEKNILELEKIYSKDGIEYVEINFNDHTYKLKENDPLSDIYLVKVINANSVVLLKGDEVLTLFLDIPVYD